MEGLTKIGIMRNGKKTLKKRKEQRDLNREQIRAQQREWLKHRTEEQLTNRKQYEKKQYLKDNREKINQKSNEWYHKNQEPIMTQKYTCGCGPIVVNRGKKPTQQHKETLKFYRR